ncbi:MAG: PQQ-dependent sugar dehydrogenase, partial [Bacteroidota bacterium]
MNKTLKTILWIVGITIAVSLPIFIVTENLKQPDPFREVYVTHCKSCHGGDLRGASLGPALVGRELTYGESNAALISSIKNGYPLTGMPSFTHALSEVEIKRLAIMINEQRLGYSMRDYKFEIPLKISDESIKTEQHSFRLETIATNLDPWPYSIALLPDGRILLTEKTKGLRIIEIDGTVSDHIVGTPKAYNDGYMWGTLQGAGWILDVAPHPKYEENGWIYLSFGDRCSNCNTISKSTGQDVSMCTLVRGRIKDGTWIDQETIWKADVESYTTTSSASIGGRISFDDRGHVFLSVGGMLWVPSPPPGNMETYVGIQDLGLPYGKIFRVYDDGGIPEDNPFYDTPNALKGIWTYGHRSPQGLEFDMATRQLWETEMGPRGGDEVNLLQAGKNYGWPLTSKGVNYDGSVVDYGQYSNIEYNIDSTLQPILDLTPSPAISSFIIYDGDAFPAWKGNMIVGSLKAATLYRFSMHEESINHQEVLYKDLA